MSPLDGGLLTGKYRRGQPTPEGRQLNGFYELPVRSEDHLYAIVDALVDIAGARNVSASPVALAWSLGRPTITSLVIGARADEQLADNLKVASLMLTAEERAQLEAISAAPLIYPYWHQLMIAKDRLSPADRTLLQPNMTGPAWKWEG